MNPPPDARGDGGLTNVLPLRAPGAALTSSYHTPRGLLVTARSAEASRVDLRRGRERPSTAPRAGGRGAAAPEASPESEQLAIGSLIAGRYRVVSHLGCGGSASVSLAVFQCAASIHKLVVLKCQRRTGRALNAVSGGLFDEARLTARMNHQHVAKVYEVTEHEGLPVIVMEHLDGRSLASLMGSASSLPELDRAARLTIMAKVLDGLHYAHGVCDLAGRPLHVVHRDLSPHNVMVTCDGQVKLIDFGIAQCTANAQAASTRRVAGKLGYMAPEQVYGVADRRADIFAAGIVLWELITLRRFWGRQSQDDVIRQLLDFHIPHRQALEVDMDDELAHICRRALSPDPNDRYATAGHMQADLERLLLARSLLVADSAIGQLVRRSFGSERLASQRKLHQLLGELEAAPAAPADAVRTRSQPAAPPPGTPRARRHGWQWAAAAAVAASVAASAALLVLPASDDAAPTEAQPAKPPDAPRASGERLARPAVGAAPSRGQSPPAVKEPRPQPPPDAPRRPLNAQASARAAPPAPRAAPRSPAAAPAGRLGSARARPRRAKAAGAELDLEPGMDLRQLSRASGSERSRENGSR